MQINSHRSRLIAALGPTNTGKTYLAFERMLGYGSGMIGFPLRLLARENYERAVEIKGRREVALITGEEKIIPSYAKYFFCTVESMPVNKLVDFLAIDEIQMCSDPDRGHIFTDRVLNARGREETMFMGAESIKYLLKKLVPEVKITCRRRFSSLTYAGSRKIVRLPPRSAVVGFTADDVYAIAELIRHQRGGAAIVMGALSPRTRNAQVDLFQNGDVDYLVATDAIGMGLNMDVDHVAFASLRKFDGTFRRELRPEEMGQIAGRAGRHMSDGTFGITGDVDELDPTVVEAIEAHQFDPLRYVYWRNRSLDFSDLKTLLASLGRAPDRYGLVKIYEPDDERYLKELVRDPEIFSSARNSHAVRLIWEVCRVPDFKKTTGGDHSRLLALIYKQLNTFKYLPVDWVANQVARLDRIDGGIDTLVGRIAGIRIWTYISHRGDWLEDASHWQGRTREVEDKLSDALHQGLTKRFVDQRAVTLVKRLKKRQPLQAVINAEGDVSVEGYFVGKLVGFRFIAEATDSKVTGKAVTKAAFKALGQEIVCRAYTLINGPDDVFSLSDAGRLIWRESEVARLVKGINPLVPKIIMNPGDLLEHQVGQKVEQRLKEWLKTHISRLLNPLLKVQNAPLEGALRGIGFQLVQGLGVLPKKTVGRQLKVLNKEDYRVLRRLGVKIGRQDIFLPALLKPKVAALAALLWAVFKGLKKIPSPPPPGRVSLPRDPALPLEFFRVAGFRQTGPLLLRIDIRERLLGQIRRRASQGPFAVDAELLNLAGCTGEAMEGVFIALGCHSKVKDGDTIYSKALKGTRRNETREVEQVQQGDVFDRRSPFAKLKDLSVGS